jgi:flagellar biosynthetic protein FliQ
VTQELCQEVAKQAVMTCLAISAPMHAAALVTGLVIGLFQAVTQIHEMTLTFIPKIVAVALAMLLFLPWIINMLVDFTTRLFGTIPTLVG